MKVKVKKLHPEARLPEYHHAGDAGMDVFCLEDTEVKAGERVQIRTGIAMELPPGYVALTWDKSGLSHMSGLHVLGGVFDHGYRGEYLIMILNTGKYDYKFKKGDKLTQLLIQTVESADIEEVSELSDSERGEKAFGSGD